jgi:hypothetical protein
MNVEQFWKLIESSRSGFDPGRMNGNMERQLEELRRLLSQLSPEELLDFRNHLLERMAAAFHWDLWGAAYLIADGCSDDGFADFRGWLISMGRRVFEAAVSEPESLVEAAEAPGVEDVFFEEFQYVPAHVYEELTGQEPPAYEGQRPGEPAGQRWSEDEGNLQQRFPKLWARYRRG